jgi:hypothetical protein
MSSARSKVKVVKNVKSKKKVKETVKVKGSRTKKVTTKKVQHMTEETVSPSEMCLILVA